MGFEIRPYHPSDLTALYRICLQTADSGQDGTALYQDPDLVGHYYAAPYAVLEPELCWVLTQFGQPCGYILGTHSAAHFRQACEERWFMPLRQRYPLPHHDNPSKDAAIIRLIHTGHREGAFPQYPAELHIDLLPVAQGQGWGQRLMHTFLQGLKQLNISGVHLGVGKRNPRARAFYQRLGFEVLEEHPLWLAMGKRL